MILSVLSKDKIRIGFIGLLEKILLLAHLHTYIDWPLDLITDLFYGRCFFLDHIQKSQNNLLFHLELILRELILITMRWQKMKTKEMMVIEAIGIMTPSGDHYSVAEPFINNKSAYNM